METHIINGRTIRNEILEQVRLGIKELPFQPVFCDVLVGDDPASEQYVRMKAKNAESVGIHFHNAHFPSTITTDELVAEIHKLNQVPNMCGLIVQLPLPKYLDKDQVLNAIDPSIDVDCLGREASRIFYTQSTDLAFPTALSCMKLLDSLNLDLSDKQITVVGQGQLVGKPVAHLLRVRGLEPAIVIKDTTNKDDIIKNADIVISGTGAGKILTKDKIKQGAVLIDAGTSESNGSIVGDVDLDSVQGFASAVSPVPGGVGPVTVAMLLSNVLQVAKNKLK